MLRNRLPFRQMLASCVGLSFFAGAAAAADAASLGRVGVASFDGASQALAVPVKGARPHVELRRLAFRQYVADISGCVLDQSEVQGQLLHGTMLEGWSLDELPKGDVVRLRMTLNSDVEPSLHTTAGGRVVISFARPLLASAKVAFPTAAPVGHKPFWGPIAADQRAADRPHALTVATAPVLRSVAPAVKSAVPLVPAHRSLPLQMAVAPRPSTQVALGSAHYDAKRGCLVIPVAGNVDPHKFELVHLNKRWAYLDVPGAHPEFSGVRYQERDDKFFQRWVMAKRPGQDTTRLSFALGAPADIAVKVESHELLVAVKPLDVMLGHRQLPFASASAAKPAPAPIAAAPVAPAKAPIVQLPVKAPANLSLPAALAVTPKITLKATAPARVRAALLAKAPVPAKGTALGRPFFDQERYGLVIPFRGKTPMFRWDAKADSSATLEVQGAMVTAGRLTQSFRRHPVMQSWQVARNNAAGTVKVALSFRHPADVVVAADPVRHELLMIPQPRLAGDDKSNALTATTLPTVLSSAKLPDDGRHLFIPFEGPVPAFNFQQINGSFAYVDFPTAKLANEAVQFFAPEFHPTLNYCLLSQREGQGVRLALALTQPGGANVYQDRVNQRLVVELGDAATRVGMRSGPQVPAPWPGEARATGNRPAEPLLKISRKAS